VTQHEFAAHPRLSQYPPLAPSATPRSRLPAKRNLTASGWRHAAPSAFTDADGDIEPALRAESVNAELFDQFKRDELGRQAMGAAMMPLLVTICWPYSSSGPLLLWLAVAGCVALMRLFVTRIYERQLQTATKTNRSVLVRYFLAVWLARAFVWGLSASLFFDRIPIDKQYLCWGIVLGAIGLPITAVALRMAVMQRYLLAAFATTMCCVLFRVSTTTVADYASWTILLPVLGWLLLSHAGTTIHARTRLRLELAYDRTQLVELLEKKSEQAEQAVKVKNRFLASAAHDMRQPVMALSLYADHLLHEPSEHQLVVPKIARAAAAVNRLFDSLFDLARMDNGQTNLRIEEIDVAELMQDMLVQFEPVAAAKSIVLKMRTAHALLATDAVRARRMIGNLVSNAIKYSPAGAKVLISARVRSNCVLVEVWDQGIGIPEAELESVFLEFYKAGNAGEASEGFGLGLSIVVRLAHALNSQLSVRSQLGRGTVFRLAMRSVNAADERRISRAVG